MENFIFLSGGEKIILIENQSLTALCNKAISIQYNPGKLDTV